MSYTDNVAKFLGSLDAVYAEQFPISDLELVVGSQVINRVCSRPGSPFGKHTQEKKNKHFSITKGQFHKKKNDPRLSLLWVESNPGVTNNMIFIKQNRGRVSSYGVKG